MSKKLPLEQHREIGDTLRRAQDALVKLQTTTGKTYGSTSKVFRLVGQASGAVSKLRCEMDHLICAENPDGEWPALANYYYGNAGRGSVEERDG